MVIDNSATKFAWGLRLGANIWASEKMAIKLQGQLMSAVQGAGGGLYFGTGGAGVGVSTYSSMLQFGLGGGITFALGGSKTKTTPPPTPPINLNKFIDTIEFILIKGCDRMLQPFII